MTTMELTDLTLLVLGWLLGILSPGVTEAIARARRRAKLAALFKLELTDLRFRVVLVLIRLRARLQTFDQRLLDSVRPVLFGQTDDPDDRQFLATTRQFLAKGDAQFIALHNLPSKPDTTPYPIPYEAPLLEAHLGDLTLFSLDTQRKLLRVRDELRMYNEQVAIVRAAHERTFDSSLSSANFAINQGNLESGLTKLAYRAEALMTSLNGLYPLETDAR